MPLSACLLRATRLTLATISIAAACADTSPGGAALDPATSADSVVLGLARPQVDLMTGYAPTATLQAIVAGVAPNRAAPRLVWSITDTTVAAVAPSADGAYAVLTARRVGATTVVVRAAAGSGRAESRVVVTAPPPMQGTPPAPAELTRGGLTVRAVTTAESDPAGAPAGTVRFTVVATITNRTSAPITVHLGGCPLSFALYSVGSWFGQEERLLAWDQLGAGRACAAQGGAAGETLVLAGGAARTLRTSVLSTDVLAATSGSGVVAPNSTLAVHARVRLLAPDSGETAVDAGTMRFTLPTTALAFRATTATLGAARDTLVAQVTLTNRGALPAYLEYGACAVRLLAYRTADRGAPAWNSDARQPWAGTYLWGCPAYLATRAVPAGADFAPGEFTLRLPLIEMLGDSLPDGRYYFSAQGRLLNAPTAAVDAGTLELTLAREPMPTTRGFDLVTYATTAAPAGDRVRGAGVVRVGVSATLTNAGSSLVTFPSSCVVSLAAYRTRAARDAAPYGGAPDWASSLAGCGAGTTEVVLSRGESRTFAAQTTARDVLGGALPDGRYYFAAVVRMPRRLVYLSAGEAELAR